MKKLDSNIEDGGVSSVATSKHYSPQKVFDEATDNAVGFAESFSDYAVKTLELNTKTAQTMRKVWLEALKSQVELGQVFSRNLLEVSKRQNETLRDIYEGRSESFFGWPFRTPFEYGWKGVEVMNGAAQRALPIRNYDELSVEEISSKIESLSVAEIEQLREYELLTKGRKSLLEHYDRKLKANL